MATEKDKKELSREEMLDKRAQELKKKYNSIFLIQAKVEVDDQWVEAHAFLRKPDRNTLRLAMSQGANLVGMTETVINNCWIEGTKGMKSNDDFMMGGLGQVNVLLDSAKNIDLKKY